MKLETLSDLFDTRLVSHEGGLVRDEYEKSLYLTKAQDLFYDTLLDHFEETNMISEKMDRLVQAKDIETFTDDKYGGKVADLGIYCRKVLRERVLFADDPVSIFSGRESQVREERLSEIETSLDNPFRTPGEHFVLRAVEESLGFNKVSLYIPDNTVIQKYTVTLAIEPEPIILEDLPDGLTIRDKSTKTAVLQFKDKDIDKIVEIAVSLVLKDAGIYAQSQSATES